MGFRALYIELDIFRLSPATCAIPAPSQVLTGELSELTFTKSIAQDKTAALGLDATTDDRRLWATSPDASSNCATRISATNPRSRLRSDDR